MPNFGYDADGRRQTFNGGTGRDLGYTYNARGGLHKVKLGGLNGTDLATYTYNLAEQRQTRTSGNGIVADHNYDAAGRLNYLGATNVLRLDFGHDSRDRRTWTLRDQNLGDTYEYFNDSELYRYRHGVTRPDQNFNNPAQRTDTFDYDESGNRREFNRGGTLTTYTAGDDNRYTAVSGATIAHDARGNVTTWDGKTFVYDADNRLVSATATGMTMTFAYDGDGRLVKLVKNGVTEYRFYDGAQVFLRTDGSGNTLDWTVWGPTPDEVIASSVSGAWQFYHQDQINSVYAVTNAAGTVLERYLYDPFGLPDVRDASWGARTSTAIGNPWLFTGQEWRGDIGLSNYKARWYQPTLGRFMQNDPVRFDAGDINLYRYCSNDPLNNVDPDGMIAFLTGLGSAAVDAAFQVTGGMMNGQSFTESVKSIDKSQVVASGVIGASPFAVAGVIKKAVATVKMARAMKDAKSVATVVEKSGVKEIVLSPVTEYVKQEAAETATSQVAKSAAVIAGTQAAKKVAAAIGSEEPKQEKQKNEESAPKK